MKHTIDIKKLDNSEVEIKGELDADDFASYWPLVIKKLSTDAEVDGFRKGHVPEKVLAEKIGEDRILVEMAELALRDLYPIIIDKNKIDAIGQPEISITKLAKNNPLGFNIKTAVIPEFSLPNYKKIAKDIVSESDGTITVSEKEVDDFIENLQKIHAPKKEDGTTEAIPELNLEFLSKFGEFKSIDEFKSKVKEQLETEKRTKEKEKKRVSILEKISTETQVSIPPFLVENELNKMLNELRGQTEQMGLKFDDYLTHLKKSVEELKSGWKKDAEKRVAFGLIMQKIAQEESLEVPDKELDDYVATIISRYGQEAEKDETNIRNYAENILLNEKIFELLEKVK